MSSLTTTLNGRCIYVWKLEPVLTAEMGIDKFVRKARRANFSSIWIKVAEGGKTYKNIEGDMETKFRELVNELKREDIDVWGWHVPYAPSDAEAQREAGLVAHIAQEFNLAGILMDAESGAGFFKGNLKTAEIYAKELRGLLDNQNKGLGISSHDIPSNFPDFPFSVFAQYATVNAPQVYYGGSPSVDNRLSRAVQANSQFDIPFIPVGAGWIGDNGGCSSASVCAEKAIAFMKLVHKYHFQGYSFWHWQGVPSKLWEVFFEEPVLLSSSSSSIAATRSSSQDQDKIDTLTELGKDVSQIAKAQKIAKEAWSAFPHNGCAANLSALLQLSGIDVPMVLGAEKLAKTLKNRGWSVVKVGEQKPGDVGVTFDYDPTPSGADHVYLVLEVEANKDRMLISDNQDKAPHYRYASGHGRTPTKYFLRA